MASKYDYVSEERLYLNSKGEVVGEKDPDKLTLLVAKGGHLSREKAQEHGLMPHDEDDDQVKAAGEANDLKPTPEQIAVRTLTPEPGSQQEREQQAQAEQAEKSATSRSSETKGKATNKAEK